MSSRHTSEPMGTLDLRLEQHRAELTAYCRRIVGSSEAEDAVQETLVRAWRSFDRFEGRAALRSWLYRIATNVCFDMSRAKERRARKIDAMLSAGVDRRVGGGSGEPTALDPADAAVSRETVRLAFGAALRYLPPRQRAVLILREVLCWRAGEVAELLDTTVASVNSALQRVRSTLAATMDVATSPAPPTDMPRRMLFARYITAFERYDLDALTTIVHEDALASVCA